MPGEPTFEIEGPDEDGFVWICSSEGRHVWCQNLGPKQQAAEVMCGWLAQSTTVRTNKQHLEMSALGGKRTLRISAAMDRKAVQHVQQLGVPLRVMSRIASQVGEV